MRKVISIISRWFKKKPKRPKPNAYVFMRKDLAPSECLGGQEHDWASVGAFFEASLCLRCRFCVSMLGSDVLTDEKWNELWRTTPIVRQHVRLNPGATF